MTNDDHGRSWPDLLARAFAVLRGAVLLLYALLLVVAPENVMPGSSGHPARLLALMLVSRTALFGLAFVVLAIRGKRAALGWVLFADAALQLFDTGMALATAKGALASLPLAIGALDFWAGRVLLRSARRS